MTNTQGKRLSTDANTGMTQILDLSDDNFPVAIISILYEIQLNTLKMHGKVKFSAEK